ncbi:hypothetical protein NEHOM01_1912 [Nematocida homosporus]|uniref:uncharacterized protein n=1 Tax=Nematocida homosporus TaxID=1912981 RepID=UPI0022205968|nr:uncharacterized protein NEHOM01_1912 [Nematocida homosporus]KAI5187079.1 hypothetical protein NEHOM01_1912 [Nematocida homosporus]
MMMRLWPKKLSWLKWVVVWLVVVLICWLLKTYGVYDWVYARLIRKPSDATPDNLTNPTKPTKVDQDTQTEPITTLNDKQKKESREKKQPGAKISESTSSAGTNTNLSLDSQSNPPQLHPTQANSIPSSDANAEPKSQESARSASSTEVGVGLEEGPEEQVRHLAPVQEEDEDVMEEEDVMNVMEEDEKRSGEGPEERVQHLAPVQEEDEEEEVSSQPSTNTKLTQTQPPNPTTPDAPLVKCLQEIHMIKKHEDHRWVYDSNLSKWDLYLDVNAVPRPAKNPEYLVLYATKKIPAPRCQEYIEQLSLLKRVRCSIPVHVNLLKKWQGHEVFKLILILLRTVEAPNLIIALGVESLFDPSTIQTEKDLVGLNYLVDGIPEEMKTRRTSLVANTKRIGTKWRSFFGMIKPIYNLCNAHPDKPSSTKPNPTQPNTSPVPTP